MPYIKSEDRPRYDTLLQEFDRLVGHPDRIITPGEVNYVLTQCLHTIIRRHGLRYSIVNDLIGVLECCKLELYRRVAVPYENKKIEENGDVA